MEEKIREELNKWFRNVRRYPADNETASQLLGMLVLASSCGAVSEEECERALIRLGNRRRGV